MSTCYNLIRESFPVARKKYRCIWCGESIPVGLKHRYEVSTFDILQQHRWHLECDKEAADYFADGETEFCPYDNPRPSVPIDRTANDA